MIMLDLTKHSGTGFTLDISKEFPGVKKIRAVMTWDPHPMYSSDKTKGFDLDLVAFLLDANGKLSQQRDVVYFNQKYSINNAVSIPVDNQTGEGEDDEYMLIEFDKIPEDRKKVALWAVLFEAKERNQHIGMVANSRVEIFDDETGNCLAHFLLTADYTGYTSVHLGDLIVKESGMEFEPIADAKVGNINDLLPLYF